MEFKLYIRALQRGWWIIVFTILVAVNFSLLISYLTTPIYQTSSRFIVSPNAGLYDNSWDIVNSLDTLDRRSIINTYKELLASRSVYGSSPELQQIANDNLDIEYAITVVVVPDTNILKLTVEGPDPNRVVMIANAIGDQSLVTINQLYPVYNFSVLEKPETPIKPIKPETLQNAGLALLIGALIGTGLAFSREQLEGTFEQLRQRSIIDSVSTAFSRVFFERQLREEITKNPASSLSLGLINLRGLDEVAEVIPKALADRALFKITETLKKELRGRDIVGRWDKNVLSVLLPSTPVNAVEGTFKRLQSYLGEPMSLDDAGDMIINPAPCIGVVSRNQLDTSDEVIKRAEIAMSQASSFEDPAVIFLTKPFVFDVETESENEER